MQHRDEWRPRSLSSPLSLLCLSSSSFVKKKKKVWISLFFQQKQRVITKGVSVEEVGELHESTGPHSNRTPCNVYAMVYP